MENTRAIVLEILLEMERGEAFGSNIIKQVLDKFDYLEAQDKAFIKRLAEGTLERKIELDYILNQFSKVPVHKMKPLIRCLMRMSVYQILYMDGVPDAAACNEAVRLAEKRKFHTLKGFVNGVLRNISRNKEQIIWPDPEKDWKKALSVKASMPEIILDIWEKDYGKTQTIRQTESLLQIKPVCVRMDENLSEEEKLSLLKEWDQTGICYQKSDYLPYAYTCSKLNGVKELPGFLEGKVTVQDVSSMLVTECAGIRKEMTILDVCAAPGGKSMHAAAKLRGTGLVESRDVSLSKTDFIRENMERMGLTNMVTKVWDARETDDMWIHKADIVYLDVPCSGLGILGKKRDIKYNVTEESLQEILELQKKIVSASVAYVKPGGILMYSTCTIRKDENQNMAEWITKEFDFVLESLDAFLPENLQNEETAGGMLQLFPDKHGCDGFFMARLRRKG